MSPSVITLWTESQETVCRYGDLSHGVVMRMEKCSDGVGEQRAKKASCNQQRIVCDRSLLFQSPLAPL